MRKYCKAYQLGRFRQFQGWTEKHPTLETEVSDESIYYLWDDFTVVSSPVQDAGACFDEVTPEWQAFCTTVLKFEIPEDLQSAYK